MRTGCRSVERLFYWWKLIYIATTTRRHNPKAPLFLSKGKACLAVTLLAALTTSTIVLGQGPALTTISDTVYRADGSLAAGTVLISWPSFLSAGGDTVAAGNLNVTLGPLGVFVAQLVPNIGASPAGTYYIVVFQLDDGTVRTEYWAVSSTSPTTIAAVQTTPGNGLANLAASKQYVDDQVANRALDSAVVHLTGSETIGGSKQFVSPPTLPQPVGANDAVTKGYVDTAVGNVGGGSFVSRAGDTMTGPLSLPGDPSLDFAFVTALIKSKKPLTPIDVSAIGNAYLADLTNANFTNVTSTTVTIDAGITPVSGGGIEVRYSDAGWGIDNNRNLVGRYTSSSFSLTRYARSQTYFLKSYDSSVPPKYSRYSAALHVDYPF
jgi:hypothetical protein